jgi:hypothetical protein
MDVIMIVGVVMSVLMMMMRVGMGRMGMAHGGPQ